MKSAGGTAAAAAAVTQPPEPAIKLGLSPFGLASTEGLTTFHYVPESIQQVVLIQDFQKRMADLEQALKREQDRSKLLQSDLTRLRLQHQWTKGGGSGSSGGPTLRHLSPCPLDSLDAATITDVSPSPCATEQLPAQASSGEATAPAATAQQRAEPPCTSPAAPAGGSGHLAQLGASSSDTVVVSRHALELLYLKERAMDAAKEGIVIADCSQPDMPLIYANEGFTRMTGYGRADVLGRNCRFLQYPPPGTSNASSPETDEAVVHVLHESITAGLPCVVQLMNYKRNGDPFINYLSLNPVHDTSGRLTHFVGVQSDITELVQHQRAELAAKHAALQAAAATEAKSQFLARMSHEIRTPLNGMIAVGQLLADTPLSPEQWDLVNTIRCSGETLLTLITDILDFSRIEANKMVLSCAEYRLQTVIEAAMEIAGLHAAQKRLQVAYSLGQSVPGVVLGDAQRLQQILLNVLNNAVKFTEAGEILLEVWAEEGVAGELLPQQQAPQQDQAQQPQGTQNSGGAGSGVPEAAADGLHTMLLHFSVRDTGIGIGMENIGRLFQSFSQVDTSPTRQHGGSGLGLAICQRLCEAMGGRMWAESGGPGEGSLFQWVIRVKLPDVVPASAKVGSATTPSSRGRCSLGCAARASAGSSACNSSDIGSIGGTPLYDLSGHRVLLVEPCPMVRQVLALALRRWGCFVCAVGSEAEGTARLKLVGSGVSVASSSSGVCGPPQPPSPPTAANCGGSAAYLAAAVGQPTHPTQQAEAEALVGPLHLEASRKLRHLELVHAAQWLDYEFQAHGPYDVIMQDMTHQNLLQALIAIAHPSEAQRVVFMGWPGQNEPEDRVDSSVMGEGSAAGSLASLPPLTYAAFSQSGGLPDMCGSGLAAQPPRMLAERLAQTQAPGQRQLGYVVVTRPVRQGRLRLALEEVLSMQLEPEGEQPAAATGRGKRQPPAGAPVSSPPATPVAGAAADPLSPTALLGLVGSGPCSDDGASSLGSRASSSSNLRCAGATLVRATSSYQHLEAMAAVTAAPLRLLLAEDNAINMKVALGILKRMGCTNVVTAVDGQAALDALHAVGGPGAFDVILMDLHMPKKGGMEAVRDIRCTWSRYSTKIIAVTADAYEDTRDNCIANGFDGWLAKPFRVEEFARVMAACRSGDALTPQRNNV